MNSPNPNECMGAELPLIPSPFSARSRYPDTDMTPLEHLISFASALSGKVVFGADEVLPHAIAALDLIDANPAWQSAFEHEFVRMPAYAPPEFIEICMHALKWQGVKSEFEARHRSAIEANDWRSEPVYRGYLEAFEADWNDAKDFPFYAQYFASRCA